jgi:5'-3' exonuclease
MREYLDLEFSDIQPVLPFDYSVERIIDDFVLLAVFVGNDFLPHLPDLHIHENGLERLFEVYKKVLPSLGLSICSLCSTDAEGSRGLHQREREDQHAEAAGGVR